MGNKLNRETTSERRKVTNDQRRAVASFTAVNSTFRIPLPLSRSKKWNNLPLTPSFLHPLHPLDVS